MKKLILIILLTFISCNQDDDCIGNTNDINQYYQEQISLANGDQEKINLLLQEQILRLSNACD